jgi:hypothetical protein
MVEFASGVPATLTTGSRSPGESAPESPTAGSSRRPGGAAPSRPASANPAVKASRLRRDRSGNCAGTASDPTSPLSQSPVLCEHAHEAPPEPPPPPMVCQALAAVEAHPSDRLRKLAPQPLPLLRHAVAMSTSSSNLGPSLFLECSADSLNLQRSFSVSSSPGCSCAAVAAALAGGRCPCSGLKRFVWVVGPGGTTH